jgi:fucose permease
LGARDGRQLSPNRATVAPAATIAEVVSIARSRPVPAGVLGCGAFLLIGWSGLLAPSLIRSVKDAFVQPDGAIGFFYFVYAVGYAIGSLGGGLVTERLGRRAVLSTGAALHGLGFVGLAVAPSWSLFVAAGLPAALGAGTIAGGGNGLFLDLFESGRGRALNVLHLFFSLGALSAPLAVGRLVEAGVEWRLILLATGIGAIAVAIPFSAVTMPDGIRAPTARGEQGLGRRLRGLRQRLAAPLLLLAVGIALYVASEVGVSNWLVRFLEAATVGIATLALSLFWAGLAVGRILAARLADRFDHLGFSVASAVAMSAALLAAILVPSVPLSIGLFGLTGVAMGPVFPMIMVLAGDRYPERSSAVTGFLAAAAVLGAIVYPPLMGTLSDTVGLTVAMLGNVILGFACAAALVAVGRVPRRADQTRPAAGAP